MFVNRRANQSGTLELQAKTAIDLLLLWGGSLFSIGGVAFAYWKKLQPEERVERARKQGRKICECTVTGEIMLLDSKTSDAIFNNFVCPRCGQKSVEAKSWKPKQ